MVPIEPKKASKSIAGSSTIQSYPPSGSAMKPSRLAATLYRTRPIASSLVSA